MDSKSGSPADVTTPTSEEQVRFENSADLMEYNEQPNFDGPPHEDKRPGDRLSKPRSLGRVQKRSNIEKKCKCCGTTNTPVWRWGGEAKDTLLCNACSLRIRRSNARPQRSKSPSERSLKRQLHSTTNAATSEGRRNPSSESVRTLTTEELDALRQKLAGFMCQEKARLLGDGGLEPQWYISPQQSLGPSPTMVMGPPRMQPPSEWFPVEQQRVTVWHGDHPGLVDGPFASPPLHDQEMAFMFA